VERPILLIGADVTEGRPKSRAGERLIWLDDDTIGLLKAHYETPDLERQFTGEAWEDNDLVFCHADGTPWKLDYVLRRFKALAKAAGLPPCTPHSGVLAGGGGGRESNPPAPQRGAHRF
jgi:integrase